jgi:hypothetical protein
MNIKKYVKLKGTSNSGSELDARNFDPMEKYFVSMFGVLIQRDVALFYVALNLMNSAVTV